jgi:hypothetical protein
MPYVYETVRPSAPPILWAYDAYTATGALAALRAVAAPFPAWMRGQILAAATLRRVTPEQASEIEEMMAAPVTLWDRTG